MRDMPEPLLPDPATNDASRRFLAAVAKHFDLAGAVLFGSRARGTHHAESDADIAVLLRGEHQRFLPVKLAMSDIAFDVLVDTGIDISPLPIWLDEWDAPETFANPALLMNIKAEGIRLQ